MGAKETSYSADNRPQAYLTRWVASLVRHPTNLIHIALVIGVVVAGGRATAHTCLMWTLRSGSSYVGVTSNGSTAWQGEGNNVID